ncbi:phage portal protein [Cytobacillus sp. NCCP-133]|uniref:phage portal protein n=1 Tax=Cytobacillus sp. NCCP-133 TaxID=766848 RepID=UPI00222EF6DF|nr:phage portal protein [Cytobacillus sp. NCCP-133]GLB58668.1 hypothetical protein NCCP133_08010 [Cytobacillus sp. NCCP-133]
MAKPFGYVSTKGKFVKSEILEKFSLKEAESKKITDKFASHYGLYGLMEPVISPLFLSTLLYSNTYHYRAVKTKARDTAGTGWELKPKHNGASQVTKKILEDFLTGLNPSPSVVWEQALIDYEAIGQGFIEVIREDYEPNAKVIDLEHIPATYVRFHADKNKICQIVGVESVWFKKFGYEFDVHMATGEEFPLGTLEGEDRANEYISIINYSPDDEYYGRPDVLPALGAVQGDIARRDFNIGFFDNYGVPAYAVFVSGNYTDEADEDGKYLEDIIREHFEQVNENPHSVLVLGVPTRNGEKVEITFQPLSTDIKEASFREYRIDNRDEILAAHGVPPYRMGIAETGSLGGSTSVEATEIYKRSVVEPRQSLIEAIMNKIFKEAFNITDWEFKLPDLDIEDLQKDLTIATGLFSMGAMTPNEMIKYFGKKFGITPSSNPAMDWHYIGGQPIDADVGVISDPATTAEIEKALKGLKDSLEVVIKNGN